MLQPIAWGLNCGTGPDGVLGAVEQAVAMTQLPLIVQPNAEQPKEVGNRRIYLCSPEYLTSYAKRFVSLGASAVGGCCGTTPEHIREMALAVKPLGRAHAKTSVIAAAEIEPQQLFVTGDPPKLGNYPDATGVFDTDSIGMAEAQRRLNSGIDIGGQPIDPKTMAVIGVGLDPTALDRKTELDRFRRKAEAGAEFAITQPVFDPEALLRFLDEVQDHGVPIIAGIWPLASYRNAQFMNNEVPGVEIPDSVMQRMASVESRDDQLKMGVQIARESVDRVADRVSGIQVSAPFGKIATALAVIEQK